MVLHISQENYFSSSIWSLGIWVNFHKDRTEIWSQCWSEADIWDLLMSTARNEKSGEKAKSERMLSPRYPTRRPSHYLLLCQTPFHHFCPSQVLFFHWFIFRMHEGQTVSKNKSLPFQKCSTISFPLRFSSEILLLCHREVTMRNKIQKENLPWRCGDLLATDLRHLDAVSFPTWRLALALSGHCMKDGAMHGHCRYSTATVPSDFTPVLNTHFWAAIIAGLCNAVKQYGDFDNACTVVHLYKIISGIQITASLVFNLHSKGWILTTLHSRVAGRGWEEIFSFFFSCF